MKENPRHFLSTLALLVCFGLPAFGIDLSMQTRSDAQGYYLSQGSLDFPQSFTSVQTVLLNFEKYREWATRGQDGRDPVSAKFTGILTKVNYDKAAEVLTIVYDVNLFWPFGSKDNPARFKIDAKPSPGGAGDYRCTIGLHFMDWSIAFEDASLGFSLTEKTDKTSRLDFSMKVKLAWFLMPFFPIEAYKLHVEKRVLLMLGSLSDYLDTMY
jgi:hypothetical protein